MSLDNFYSLRKDFIILGLTGKMQSGADKFVDILSQDKLNPDQKKFISEFVTAYKDISDSEARKARIIKKFFFYNQNWKKFDVIEYKNVVLLFILHHCYSENIDEYAEKICNWISELGTYRDFITPRFCSKTGIAKGSEDFIKKNFKNTLKSNLEAISSIQFNNHTLNDYLIKERVDFFFNSDYQDFAKNFFESLDLFSIYLRHKLIHITTYCLRRFGTLKIENIKNNIGTEGLKDIYIIAEVINQIIKIHRDNSGEEKKTAHIIIDRLKNSYEMMYFREKYSGFYAIVNNRVETKRLNSIKEKIDGIISKTDILENVELINNLDETEYKINEFKEGNFEGFDIENCVQKADFHIWYDEKYDHINTYENLFDINKEVNIPLKNLPKTNEYYVYQPYLVQVLKLIALIQQPGIITPTYIERCMQIAFNAKLNSGCISRQVGAIVTDSNFSIKGIGWNEVPVGQVPCGLRDIRDLVENRDLSSFTEFEKNNDTQNTYSDKENFNQKIKKDFLKAGKVDKKLKGRPCPYCFKAFHNKYEAKDNQVHTRSLHAEENAMLQISKYGGQPLQGGNLFTTASPCELCSKKAYQLGIRNIFFIDLYPGISQKQILEAGKSNHTNPILFHFSGAIGRGFQKLYEPFMSIKDETILRSGIIPSDTDLAKALQIKSIFKNILKDHENKQLKDYLDNKNKENIIQEMIILMNKGLNNVKNK